MSQQPKKNIFSLVARLPAILLLAALMPLNTLAQQDTAEAVLLDTLYTGSEEAPPPAIEEKTYEDEPAETGIQYFLTKEETGEDSFEVISRALPDSLVKEMQEDENFWYANTEIKKEGNKNRNTSAYVPLIYRKWFQDLLWIVIIAVFAGFIMWYLSGTNVGLFRKKDTAVPADNAADEIPEDIFVINYQKEIDKATGSGNYRLAVRLMFLRLLKQMAEKNIIQYKQDRTNLDYLMQLQPTGYYNNFFRITRNYEYSWYGQFPVSQDAYQVIRGDFDQLDKQLR